MLVYPVETYFRMNKENEKINLPLHIQNMASKYKQTQILRPFIFPAILLGVDAP